MKVRLINDGADMGTLRLEKQPAHLTTVLVDENGIIYLLSSISDDEVVFRSVGPTDHIMIYTGDIKKPK